MPGVSLTCIANTADDLDYAGVHVSPDVDAVTYALAGLFDEARGFGVVGDTFRNAEALRRYGWGWFAVGDADLATSLRRTEQSAGRGDLVGGHRRPGPGTRRGGRRWSR